MKSRFLFLLMVVISIFIFWDTFMKSDVTSKAEEKVKKSVSSPELFSWFEKGVLPVGIVDPDGRRSVWATSKPGADGITRILAGVPVEPVQGISFYKVPSWEKTSHVMMIAYEDRDKAIWSLFNEVVKLKSRVKTLEDEVARLKK